MGGLVYLVEMEGVYKIGITENLRRRLDGFSCMPWPVRLVHSIATPHAAALERALHRHFAACRMQGEWFRLSPEQVAFVQGIGPCQTLDALPAEIRPRRASTSNRYDLQQEAEAHRLAASRGATLHRLGRSMRRVVEADGRELLFNGLPRTILYLRDGQAR